MLSAGGGLQVAAIQLAITLGASIGGVLFDSQGWWTTFLFAAVLLVGSCLFAIVAGGVFSRGADESGGILIHPDTFASSNKWKKR